MIRGRNKRYKNAAIRRKPNIGPGGDNRLTSRTPISVASVTFGSHDAVITYDQDVVLDGIPQYVNDLGHLPTGASKTGLGEVTLTYADATSTSVAVPFEDPGVRNGAGGYVLPGTFSAD